MKCWKIFCFELAYQVRRPWPWLFVAVLMVLSFLMTRDGSFSEVLYADFFLNSPFAVIKTTVFGTLLWLVMAAAIAGDAAARDVATGMYPLAYTSSITKADYLGGRFVAALVLNALILLAVQAGILLGVYLPGVDAALIGPFRPAAFLTAYAIISLPNAFAITAIQFLLAAKSGRAMAGYLASFLIVFLGFFVASFLLYNQGLGAFIDPIGIRFIVEDIAHQWTTVEKNWRLLKLEGVVLTNRLVWLGVGVGSLAIAYFSFEFTYRTPFTWWSRKKNQEAEHAVTSGISSIKSTPIPMPQISRSFGFLTYMRQLLLITWTSFKTVAISWAGVFQLLLLPLMSLPIVLDQMESRGIPILPSTINVLSELTGSLADELSRWVIIPFLIVFFVGELVWRERDARMNEITDTTPTSDWVPFLGKFLGLALAIMLFLVLQIVAGILAQTMLNYQKFEVGLYLKVMLGFQFIDYLLFALLALVVHVVVNQKYIAHLVAIIAFVFIAMASLFGVEHNLLIYGAAPGWSYTDMRGFGPYVGPWVWFKLYWAAWALLLAIVGRLLWVRSKEISPRARLQLARQRLKGTTTWTAAVAAGLVFILGGFIFYNTNIRNEYLTASEKKARQAAYELIYGGYASLAQPQLAATKLHVEVYPEQRAVDISGVYNLVNRSGKAIDSIHVATVRGVETGAAVFDQPADLVLADEKLYYSIYALKKPLQPGDSLQLNFQVHVKPNGFSENGVDISVTDRATSFTNAWLPAIGYQESPQLLTASDRREHNLMPRPLIASLYDLEARKKHGEGIKFEAVVGTRKDQVAVAPGALRRTWTEGERRYFHYSSDKQIGGEWGFFSSDYAVHREQWQNPDSSGQVVDLQIFYQPEHKQNVSRLVKGVRASLDYYTSQFGPYEYSYLSLVERPGRGTGMHADASMITFAEGFATWQPGEEAGSVDVPFAVVAHEMAHQWTVPYANVEGAPVMSESLAWFYAMQVVEKVYGAAHFNRFMDWMRAPYRQEIKRGEPLLRGLDPYMSYRKGPFALYTISESIGIVRVNGALRRLLEKHNSQDAPLATTLDLYRELKASTPDSLEYLLYDLFEVNTNWQLETKQATAKQTQAGEWRVTLQVQARKVAADSAGVETEKPMQDWVEVGIFSKAKDGTPKPLYLQKHSILSGQQTLQVTVPQKPVCAGIDPNHLLTDHEVENNIRAVEIIQKSTFAKPSGQHANQSKEETAP